MSTLSTLPPWEFSETNYEQTPTYMDEDKAEAEAEAEVEAEVEAEAEVKAEVSKSSPTQSEGGSSSKTVCSR